MFRVLTLILMTLVLFGCNPQSVSTGNEQKSPEQFPKAKERFTISPSEIDIGERAKLSVLNPGGQDVSRDLYFFSEDKAEALTFEHVGKEGFVTGNIPGTYTVKAIFNKVQIVVGTLVVKGEVGPFCGGDGSIENPYLVCSISTLALMKDPAFQYKNFKLVKDLDLSGDNFSPLGPLSGTLDGAGFKIKGIKINQLGETYNIGFINVLEDGGEVKNLNLEIDEIYAPASGKVGGVVGKVATGSKISNVHVVIKNRIHGGMQVGGIAGESSGSFADNVSVRGGRIECGTGVDGLPMSGISGGGAFGLFMNEWGGIAPGIINSLEVHDLTVSCADVTGGAIGWAWGADILNVKVNRVSVIGNDQVGGAFGAVSPYFNLRTSTLNNVQVSDVDVKGSSRIVGGIVGLHEGGSIENSFANARIEGTEAVGGLIGWAYVSTSLFIDKTYSSSSFTRNAINIGGLIGFLGGSKPVTISNSYSNSDIPFINNQSAGLVGKMLIYSHIPVIKNVFSYGIISSGNCLIGAYPLFDESLSTGMYYNKTNCVQKTGFGITAYGIGLTETQITNEFSFPGFDFQQVWIMGDKYPVLKMEYNNVR